MGSLAVCLRCECGWLKMKGRTREQLCDCVSVFEEMNQGQDVAWWLRNFVMES